jgi:hypothetical protein
MNNYMDYITMQTNASNYNVKKTSGKSGMPAGFTSLAEMLAALTIGAMVIIAVLGIYHRAENSVDAITRRLDSSRLPGEILQRIAEDLDNIVSSGSDATITIENKFENIASVMLVPAARLTITRTIQDSQNNPQKFQEIIWQSSYDFKSAGNSLTLYRSSGGLNMEDKVLEKNRDELERELFVPICSGITYFKIAVLAGGKNPIEKWNGSPPPGIIVTISFAEPYKKADGTFDVPDEDKITRTIAIDRTRKIRFDTSTIGSGNDVNEPADVNSPEEQIPPSKTPENDKTVKIK